VTLTRAAEADTDVALSVADADKQYLTVDATVTVKKGDATAPIKVSGVKRNPTPIVVTATLLGVSQTGTVRVLDDGTLDVPTLTAITPAPAKVPPGGKVTLNVVLDLPAPSGLAAIALTTDKGWSVNPTAVTVPTDALLGPFDVTPAGQSLTETVTATQTTPGGPVTATATLSIDQHVVINEVDYDNVGTDTAEFVELYNPSPSALDLSTLAVVVVTATPQKSFALSGTLDAGHYLVLGPAGLFGNPQMLPPNTTFQAFPAATNQLANGPPTGVALVNTVTFAVIDSVSFGGKAVVKPTASFPAAVPFYEGAGTTWITDSNTTQGSCIRKSDGVDTNDTQADWAFSPTPTPGAKNQ
jgi:hypothetical protein